MKIFENLPNLDVDAFYAWGKRIRDKRVDAVGTNVGFDLFSDIIENVQKIVQLSGITRNDSSDNDSSGYQIIEAINITLGNIYSAHINAAGTTVSEKGNDLYSLLGNGVISISKLSTGIYEINTITSTPSDYQKYQFQLTSMVVGGGVSTSAFIRVPPTAGAKLQIQTVDMAGVLTDSDFYIDIKKVI